MTRPAYTVLLMDNGSLRPESIRAVRKIAVLLEARTGLKVTAVPLLHGNRVDAALLDGKPAQTLVPFLEDSLSAGNTHFIILPLFFGLSRALTEFVPEQLQLLQERFPAMDVRLADCLAGKTGSGEAILAHILADHIRTTLDHTGWDHPQVALVDHGSPVQELAALRNRLADHVAGLLASSVQSVRPCSMERRPDPEYTFNEPLLENLLMETDFRNEPVVIAMQFLLPGRHAGPEGDVAQIIESVRQKQPALKTAMTPLAAEHPQLIDLLATRCHETLPESVQVD